MTIADLADCPFIYTLSDHHGLGPLYGGVNHYHLTPHACAVCGSKTAGCLRAGRQSPHSTVQHKCALTSRRKRQGERLELSINVV